VVVVVVVVVLVVVLVVVVAASAARRGCNIQPSLGETSPSLDLKVILGFKIS